MKLVKCIPEFYFFTVFLKNRNISSKIKRSKATDYAALRVHNEIFIFLFLNQNICFGYSKEPSQ